MAFSNSNLPYYCFIMAIAIGIIQPLHAQNDKQDFLDGHNIARAQVGVKNITWNNTVAAYALNYANQRRGDCELIHSNGSYGENLARGSPDLSATEAVNLWVNEKAYYNYTSNSCIDGKECHHYTQVVWRNSTHLGCARVHCANNTGTFVICNYDPAGNIVGQYPY
uniref:PR-1b n=1 Tax=Nepenthes alata TaxID=4376 RepID=A0A173M1Y8_NEPAL|nr:PR-1b [Nepenthes alata]